MNSNSKPSPDKVGAFFVMRPAGRADLDVQVSCRIARENNCNQAVLIRNRKPSGGRAGGSDPADNSIQSYRLVIRFVGREKVSNWKIIKSECSQAVSSLV